jgi:hypothetical protein
MKPVLMRDIPPRTAAVIVALAFIASVVSGGERIASTPAIAEPAARADPARAEANTQPAAANLDDLDLGQLERREKRGRVNDLFANNAPPPPPAIRRAPSPPPAPAVVAAAAPAEPAPRPTAPALPFRYLGKLVDGANVSVFLERNQDTLSVPVGGTIAGTYRVESVSESAVVFVYLPLGERQTLAISARQQ